MNNACSLCITVPQGISLVAKAPSPPFGEGRTSKYSVVKSGLTGSIGGGESPAGGTAAEIEAM